MTSAYCQLILDDVTIFRHLAAKSTFLYSLHPGPVCLFSNWSLYIIKAGAGLMCYWQWLMRRCIKYAMFDAWASSDRLPVSTIYSCQQLSLAVSEHYSCQQLLPAVALYIASGSCRWLSVSSTVVAGCSPIYSCHQLSLGVVASDFFLSKLKMNKTLFNSTRGYFLSDRLMHNNCTCTFV